MSNQRLLAAAPADRSEECLSTQAPVTREQLYELVWSKPMLRVAEDFGVSSSYMARVCTELRVPRPPQGYWTRVEFGAKPTRTPLSPNRDGDVKSWQPGSSISNTQRTAQKTQPVKPVRPAEGESPAKHGRPARRSTVTTTVASPISVHPMLMNVNPIFLKTRRVDNGLLRPFKKVLVDILTSEETLTKAIDTANALFLALRAKGHQVTFIAPQSYPHRHNVDVFEKPGKHHDYATYWSPDRPTVVYIGEVPIGLTIFEMVEEVETVNVGGKYIPVRDLTEQQLRRYSGIHHWRSTKVQPTGRLALQAYCPTSARVKWVESWKENKPGELRGLVDKVVRTLESAVPTLKEQLEQARAQAEEEHRLWVEQRKKWEEEYQRQREAAAAKAAMEDLHLIIEKWGTAQRIEAFFDAALEAAKNLPPLQREAVVERVGQARKLARAPAPLEMLARWKTPQERL